MTASAYKPFERLWMYATFAYLAGVVLIAAYVVHTGGNWDMLTFFVSALGLGFISFGALAMYTGEVHLKGGHWYRSENPIMY